MCIFSHYGTKYFVLAPSPAWHAHPSIGSECPTTYYAGRFVDLSLTTIIIFLTSAADLAPGCSGLELPLPPPDVWSPS